ncbi:transcriptional regulator CynR [Cupriavidus sp. WS]|uniref:transcriptional regulator CynR n=1 Tax=Cupriavidus sp. WS TaxID=1312922 RepID=UPI000364BAC2|nr:transcriptional regulator CynR [Cupriavidus sp. WS]
MLLRHVRYFLAVAECGNFTRAAEALHVSQPTLSQQIRQLEDTLGVQLFDRSGRSVRTTDAGQAYLLYARRALQDLEAGKRAVHDVQELTRGSLRLAMTPTFTPYLVGPLVMDFNERYPGIVLSVLEMPQAQIEQMLLQDSLDMGIAFKDVRLADIDTQPLLLEPLALVVGAGHRYARRRTPLTRKEMQDEPFALLTQEFATRHYIDNYLGRQGIVPQVALEANSVSAVVEAVRRGRLMTVLPAAIAQDSSDLRKVRLEPPLPPREAALLQRRGAYRSAAVRAFVAFAQEVLPAWTPAPDAQAGVAGRR